MNTSFIHVMVQGVNKEYIFDNEIYIERYLEIFNKNKEEYNLTMMAYCIMNNHAHFLMYIEDINEFGKFMQRTNLTYAQMYNREKNRCGVLFRNRYQTEPIYNIKYLINCIKYIHNNPVNAQMVSKCEEYKYSSYNDYIKNIGLTQSKIMKELFGDKCDYSKMFKETYERKFMDITDEKTDNIDNYIIEGMRSFKKEQHIEIAEILSNRQLFKNLINFLKEDWGIKYVEIQNFFDIPRGTMDYLKQID